MYDTREKPLESSILSNLNPLPTESPPLKSERVCVRKSGRIPLPPSISRVPSSKVTSIETNYNSRNGNQRANSHRGINKMPIPD